MHVQPTTLLCCFGISNILELVENATIEERVALLEIQVVVIQDDMAELDEDVTLLEGDVNFLFEEQIIQDERLLNLEEDSDAFDNEIDGEPVSILICDQRSLYQIR